MPVLIDCYNVLHAGKPPALAGLDTAGLCAALGRSPWAKEGVTVVCDGAPHALGLSESPVEDVELVYAGPRSADAEIIARIDACTAPRRLIVVSSDHEIRRAARRRRARSWTSEDFLHRLAGAMGRPPQRGKPTDPHLGPESVRAWLDAFGLRDPDELEKLEGLDVPEDFKRRSAPPAEPEADEPEEDEGPWWPPPGVTPL